MYTYVMMYGNKKIHTNTKKKKQKQNKKKNKSIN